MCLCTFPTDCAGTGLLICEGCGGDQCVCRCGGERPCQGCDWCEPPDLSESSDEPGGEP